MTAEMEVEEPSSLTILIHRKLKCLSQIEIEPVGQWYHQYESSRSKNHCSFASEEESSEDDEEEEVPEVEIEDNINFLRSLDPADWKKQDHYAVLGLQKYRYKSSDEDIKKAYRIMVLRHHPDKRKGAGEEIREDDDYFTCITKAYETLGTPAKRRAFDSVDTEFDEYTIKEKDVSKKDFFELFGPFFESNARWSTRKHIQYLGKNVDSKEKVEKFYNFWYEFDSWREFSYLDEEEKEKGQDREERRWIEKQNRAERLKRKKEEMSRIRKVVDLAYSNDPRIMKYRAEERERKLAIKKAKQDEIRKKQEEIEAIKQAELDAIQKIKDAEEAALKVKQEIEKKEREANKKIMKRERKTLRALCKDNEYFTTDAAERAQAMMDVEYMCQALASTQLEALNKDLEESNKDKKKSWQLLNTQVSILKKRIEDETCHTPTSSSKSNSNASNNVKSDKVWDTDDTTILIKAVNLFPAGTNKRWEVVAEYINQHSTVNKERNAKDVLNKAKDLQKSDVHMKEAANKNAYQNTMEKTINATSAESDPSQRLETLHDQLGMNLTTWGTDEQRLLEQALKTYPSNTKDRWDRISECVPNRSKKDCMKRYKELVEMVKAKKAAQVAAKNK